MPIDEIKNYYAVADKYLPKKKINNPGFVKTQMIIPHRTLVIGSSGSGKTNAILDYLNRCQNTFFMIYVVYKETERLYELLDKTINEPLRKEKLQERVLFFNDINKLPTLNEIGRKDDKQILMIFDDMVLENTASQNKIGEFFIRGRKLNISIFYLSQSYYGIKNKIIRQNMNYLWIVKLPSDKDIKLILKEYSLGIDEEDMLNMYKYCSSFQFSFFKIDLQTNDMHKKFSQGFTNFLEIE
jgi:hypothetical protein